MTSLLQKIATLSVLLLELEQETGIECQAPSVCANFRVVVSGIGVRIPNP